jgi:hypothetical protein
MIVHLIVVIESLKVMSCAVITTCFHLACYTRLMHQYFDSSVNKLAIARLCN